eukprot:scaffold169373_cov26-Tisochrysis_lutea.AAC.1
MLDAWYVDCALHVCSFDPVCSNICMIGDWRAPWACQCGLLSPQAVCCICSHTCTRTRGAAEMGACPRFT